ncbi:MAG: isoamylase [Treponema sp.]|nr:isoamylase [Treponema sp.]
MDGPGAPQILGKDIVFTTERSSYHFVGIAFDFENYKIIHPFKIRTLTDEDGEPTRSWFFYILTPPENLTSISYRLILDGLWTTDPLNSNKEYDTTLGVTISKLAIDTRIPPETYQKNNGSVHFVYKGESGQCIRLGGTFTNWDSWIYYLNETTPGIYEIDIPLTSGTYYYTFYRGITPLIDAKNPIQAYTQDGRIASVIHVK